MKSEKTAKSSSQVRCINIDWLEVYCLESYRLWPVNADYFRSQGWSVQERDYGTRVYREMFTLYDHFGEPYIEVRRAPSQSEESRKFFEPYSCHLRLHNVACYDQQCVQKLIGFMNQHGYTFKKLYRIDICNDFVRFDKGDDPQTFLHRYMQGRFSKINQTNVAAHGLDQWDGRYWNSLSWGQPKSMVSTKFYNKTMELEQVKDKPYIRLAWMTAGLIDDPVNMTKTKADGTTYKPNIWRVEFSIKSSAAKWYVIEDRTHRKKSEIIMPNTLEVYAMHEQLLTVFESLAQHYFHFKHFKAGQRKDRCPDKVLFEFNPTDTLLKVDRMATHTPKSKPLERFLQLVREYRMQNPTTEIRSACDTIIRALERAQVANMTQDPYDRVLTGLLQTAISWRIKHPDSPVISMSHLIEIAKDIIDNKPFV